MEFPSYYMQMRHKFKGLAIQLLLASSIVSEWPWECYPVCKTGFDKNEYGFEFRFLRFSVQKLSAPR
jgi:hypothetical protein